MSFGFAELLRKKDLSLSLSHSSRSVQVRQTEDFPAGDGNTFTEVGEKILPFDIIVRMYVFEETLALL